MACVFFFSSTFRAKRSKRRGASHPLSPEELTYIGGLRHHQRHVGAIVLVPYSASVGRGASWIQGKMMMKSFRRVANRDASLPVFYKTSIRETLQFSIHPYQYRYQYQYSVSLHFTSYFTGINRVLTSGISPDTSIRYRVLVPIPVSKIHYIFYPDIQIYIYFTTLLLFAKKLLT